MTATAPCILALSVSLDAVVTLSLVLLSYDGPFWAAMLPRTGDLRLDIAGSLADLLGLQLLRSSLAMLPLLGVGLGTAPFGAAISALLDCAMTAWLITKAVLQVQLADGRSLLAGDTGVALQVPLLLAAEVFGIIMTWTIFALVWVNRRVIKQPAGRGSRTASIHGPYVALMAQNVPEAQPQASVVSWLAQSSGGDVEAGTSTMVSSSHGGHDLAQPLLQQQGASGGAHDDDGAESFVTAVSHSRQGSRASSLTSIGSIQELIVPSSRSSSRLGRQ